MVVQIGEAGSKSDVEDDMSPGNKKLEEKSNGNVVDRFVLRIC